MTTPTDQNQLNLLTLLGRRMHRMVLDRNFEAAVPIARKALALLKEDPALSDSVRLLEDRLEEDGAPDLRGTLDDLGRLIRSVGVSARAFLFLVQNAPDQRVRKPAPAGGPRRAAVVNTLIRHWERGEHEKAQSLLTGIALSARDGDVQSLARLGALISSNDVSLSVNAGTVAEVLEETGWHEFALKLIDPRHPLLIPGLHPSTINPNLLLYLLAHPPPLSEAAPALASVLRRKPEKDPWNMRNQAAQGLFGLTTPLRAAVLGVDDFWNVLIDSWPVRFPVLHPARFAQPGKDPRWDLYEDHLGSALCVAENGRHPASLREAALSSVWSGYGGPESAPKRLWIDAYERSLALAEKEPDLVWPVAASPLSDLVRAGIARIEPFQDLIFRQMTAEKLAEESRQGLAGLMLGPETSRLFRKRLVAGWRNDPAFRERLRTASRDHTHLRGRLQSFLSEEGLADRPDASALEPAIEVLGLLKRLANLAEILDVRGLEDLVNTVERGLSAARPAHLKIVADALPETSSKTSASVEPPRLSAAERPFSDRFSPIVLQELTAVAEGLEAYGVVLEAPFVSDLMRNTVKHLIEAPDSGLTAASGPVEAFRRHLYPLHPAAAVSGWLDATGMPWISFTQPMGHRIEGALALLRWIREREREPEEIRTETAKKYFDLEERLTGRKWTSVQPRPLEWWQRRLTEDLPATLALQERQARDSGAPRSWAIYVRNHPEVLDDLTALSRSSLPGTSRLAERVLRILQLRPVS